MTVYFEYSSKSLIIENKFMLNKKNKLFYYCSQYFCLKDKMFQKFCYSTLDKLKILQFEYMFSKCVCYNENPLLKIFKFTMFTIFPNKSR